MHGFYRIACAVPEIRVGDVEFNVAAMKELIRDAESRRASLLVFPELSITAYTCADLFSQSHLLESVHKGAAEIADFAKSMKLNCVFGAPLRHRNSLYNCAVVVSAGKISGVVPKSYIPNYREFYEKRWFSSGLGIAKQSIRVAGELFPFGTDLLFEKDDEFSFAVEICEDLWHPLPPSSFHALAGAKVIANLSSSNELVGKAQYRSGLVRDQSARTVSAYAYASSGVWESSTDLVFGGHSIIAENGQILKQNERFSRKSEMICADVDCRKLAALRTFETSFNDAPRQERRDLTVGACESLPKIERSFPRQPFVPSEEPMRAERCREIFSIQSAGLAKRLSHVSASGAVIGISGGLDSTLALLVIVETFKILGWDLGRIISITMPGFGTGGRTLGNAVALCRILGSDLRKIDIRPACEQHFKDIGHSQKMKDVTYENVQARERTQLLMDIANKEGGIVIGTSDLSEIAMGWSTYSGDHISMYSVNCGVPKTLVRHMVSWIASKSSEKLRMILEDILDTPVSPELLPSDDGANPAQKTEEIIGPYELHDFFLYHFVRYGASPEKILMLASIAFKGVYGEDEIRKWLSLFVGRFFSQQFKRSCIPDGPKVGTIALSPRGDWRMPSDADAKSWLKSLKKKDL